MDISSIIASNNAPQQSPAKKAGAAVKAAIDSIISNSRPASATDDVAALSLATQLQSNTIGLRKASGNLALTSSRAQVVSAGVVEIRSALKTLKSLAEQAGKENVSSETRARLNNQFKEFTAKIDAVVNATTFDGKKLLNGDLKGNNALSLRGVLAADANPAESITLAVDNLSSAGLFDGKTLDLSSPENAKTALKAVDTALAQVTDIRDRVNEFQRSVDYIAASVDSVVANQAASSSLLPELDLLAAKDSGQFSLVELQKNVAKALAAQGNLFNPTLLKLVS